MNPQIGPVVAAEVPVALRLLVQDLPEPEAASQLARWQRAIDAGELPAEGLLVAREQGRLAGAVWVQPHPGAYGLLLPPGLVSGQPAATADALLQAGLRRAGDVGVRLVQCLLPLGAEPQAALLERHEFARLAELVYLVCLNQAFPRERPQGDWRCLEYVPEDEPHLLATLERSYEGSLDCPGLTGLRTAADALAGYAAVGSSGTEHWYLVEAAEGLVGCLLMADHPADGPRELVYLGLVPEVRGRGWGAALSHFAQWTARQAGKQLLVLAVDAANGPAVAAYAQAGFTRWEQRLVLVRNLASSLARGD